ncbi:hypothetical protein [Rhodospirillum rubrum]|uniref:Uncharacterized protein n=1 Tax=Rhodospirillum rubrum (strain ATCC 11170 / ATH 1.1.1 / DSM 467 / LMG 4362 / NCIMB 8255 / S1) TaxID=269796 RepID=Q2RR82_RHORT|nr:hypothetical protein [Rhodospirillum rubrum]ABC23363.1 hypothetical protein Rru_A2566 [Rhodospirillum rubrum ATCC 11170]MBK5955008.1 hypothetical protein [Rhodospirillum rubrum]QXG79337.1 hypothetical protein KUL73_13240 [Rhodospirillum rubrum]HAP99180.1 hypothetical protein [Rhodospirillum rubrum]HCF17100.1 hypothetical protein [Rhodospirillum rubrum]
MAIKNPKVFFLGELKPPPKPGTEKENVRPQKIIPVATQEMIAPLDLTGRLFTLDALHCQKTFEIARQAGNHLLVQAKINQFPPV